MKDIIRVKCLLSTEVEKLLNQQIKKRSSIFISIFSNGIMV